MLRANDESHFVFLTSNEIEDFVKQWTSLAATLRAEFDERGAAITEKRARELQEWIAAKRDDTISVNEASAVSGFSTDHLRRQLGSGDLKNAGERGRPRIRRGEVRPKGFQRLARSNTKSYDPVADVRALEEIRRGA